MVEKPREMESMSAAEQVFFAGLTALLKGKTTKEIRELRWKVDAFFENFLTEQGKKMNDRSLASLFVGHPEPTTEGNAMFISPSYLQDKLIEAICTLKGISRDLGVDYSMQFTIPDLLEGTIDPIVPGPSAPVTWKSADGSRSVKLDVLTTRFLKAVREAYKNQQR